MLKNQSIDNPNLSGKNRKNVFLLDKKHLRMHFTVTPIFFAENLENESFNRYTSPS